MYPFYKANKCVIFRGNYTIKKSFVLVLLSLKKELNFNDFCAFLYVWGLSVINKKTDEFISLCFY